MTMHLDVCNAAAPHLSGRYALWLHNACHVLIFIHHLQQGQVQPVRQGFMMLHPADDGGSQHKTQLQLNQLLADTSQTASTNQPEVDKGPRNQVQADRRIAWQAPPRRQRYACKHTQTRTCSLAGAWAAFKGLPPCTLCIHSRRSPGCTTLQQASTSLQAAYIVRLAVLRQLPCCTGTAACTLQCLACQQV